MQLTVFQSDKGDCLLLTNAAGTARVLVDGGMPASYSEHVAPLLGRLRTQKKKLDLVYVSHVDQDHIGGVLRMLDDEVLWRVHEFQKTKNRNKKHKTPAVVRPPAIGAIWHNAFKEQLKKDAGPVEEMLAATAPLLSGSEIAMMREAGAFRSELATSIKQAIRLSRRIGKKQLKIPLNPQAKGKLMMVRRGQKPVSLGGMRITIVGPAANHLTRLRERWKNWLDANKKALASIREAAVKDQERLGTGELGHFLLAMKLQAEAFGDPGSITPENLASLMLLVEENGKSILLTGDGRWDQLIEGLEATGHLSNGGTLDVDILKVPHHGSRNNIADTKHLDRIVAKHYVFCGNGGHGNPHPDVVKLMVKHRLKAPGKFKFWFNSSTAVQEDAHTAAAMEEVEKVVRQQAKASKGRMTFKFLQSGSSMTIG